MNFVKQTTAEETEGKSVKLSIRTGNEQNNDRKEEALG